MKDRADIVRELDEAVRELRHARFGLYGARVRQRFLDGLPKTVTPVEYRVLRLVEASSPPPRVSDIADALLSDRARAVRVVDRLAAAGLVVRVRDDVDRRVRLVALTESGRGHLALACARRVELLGAAMSDWPDEDVRNLTALLVRLNEAVSLHLPLSDQ